MHMPLKNQVHTIQRDAGLKLIERKVPHMRYVSSGCCFLVFTGESESPMFSLVYQELPKGKRGTKK